MLGIGDDARRPSKSTIATRSPAALILISNSLIDGKFVGCPDADDYGYRHASGQAKDINEGVAAVPAQLADGEKEIIFEHAVGFRIQRNYSQQRTCFSIP